MKLQNLIIIFIIIIIPIVFIFSYYLDLEADTIRTQMDYDEKLIEATKEALEAFEINTIEWNSKYSTLANSKRRDITSSINVFTSSLVSKLGIGGMAKDYLLDYIPAIVYIMYDGYYIYTPTYVPQNITDETGKQYFYYENATNSSKITTNAVQDIDGEKVQGKIMYVPSSNGITTTINGGKSITFTTNINDAKKTYKHVLKTFVPYTSTIEKSGKKYIINYSLDNYVRIIGDDIIREGYVEDWEDIRSKGFKYRPYTNTEILKENIAVRDSENEDVRVESYQYVYNTNNDKRYYDSVADRFFIVNNNYVKIYLPEVDANHQMAEFKRIDYSSTTNINDFFSGEKHFYQLLNKKENHLYTISNGQYVEANIHFQDHNGVIISWEDMFDKDYSSRNYYVEAMFFNLWLRNTFGNDYTEILNNKKQNIINNINNNLKLSMANYSANSSINYRLPEITDEDWSQALSNISVITFFQGAKIGIKTYNNYAIVTSNENNEFISKDSLYYYNSIINHNIPSQNDKYYHTFGCYNSRGENEAYLKIDFKPQSYTIGDNTYRYYKHCDIDDPLSPCFNCIVNTNTKTINDDIQNFETLQDRALARERYIKLSRSKLVVY